MHALLILAMALPVAAATTPTPPAQPASGPGGAEYRHATVTQHTYGSGGGEYWLFEPASPAPSSAPVVVFLHGWTAMEPRAYGAWIKHLVRRGNIVVYPRYQDGLFASMQTFTPNAVAALKAAFRELQGGAHVRPELERVAVVGHSMGGALTANLGALAAAEGLPQPKALMVIEPGNKAVGYPQLNMPLADLGRIPPATLMLVIVGADDGLVGAKTGADIFRRVPQIPAANKNLITMRSDDHGSPALKADHFAPLAPDAGIGRQHWLGGGMFSLLSKAFGGTDALDWFGFWKLFDALSDAAFRGADRHVALGNTAGQRFMGKWSDGVPVKELAVQPTPSPRH